MPRGYFLPSSSREESGAGIQRSWLAMKRAAQSFRYEFGVRSSFVGPNRHKNNLSQRGESAVRATMTRSDRGVSPTMVLKTIRFKLVELAR